jgi:hypothetical protein
MCLQCVTNAETIAEDIILGYDLMVSTNDSSPDWPKGYCGLVKCNDPDFIWEGRPIYDPLAGMSDQEINLLADEATEWVGWEEFVNFVSSVTTSFDCDPRTGYNFVKSCTASGYVWEKDGDVVMWFLNKVGRRLLGND